MSDLLEVPAAAGDQTAFNLKRWEELLADPELRKIEGRVETDRFGRILMSPPPAYDHGGYQSEIAYILKRQLKNGRVTTETPISTSKGVRAADVVWASDGFIDGLPEKCVCLPSAPEICVEVVSPSNTREELLEKRALYFEAGALEFWLCVEGRMSFYSAPEGEALARSGVCAEFPLDVEL